LTFKSNLSGYSCIEYVFSSPGIFIRPKAGEVIESQVVKNMAEMPQPVQTLQKSVQQNQLVVQIYSCCINYSDMLWILQACTTKHIFYFSSEI